MNTIVAGAIGGAAGGAIVTLLEAAWRKFRKEPAGKRSAIFNVLTVVFVIGGARLATIVGQPSMEEQVDRANPALAALHKYFPADYQKMMATVRAQGPGTDPALVHSKMLPYVSNLIAQHAGELDDQRSFDSFSLVVDEMRLLREKSPSSCVAMLNGTPLTVDLSTIMTPEMQKRDLANTAAVLEQVATHPAAPASPLPKTQITSLVTGAFAKLNKDQQIVVGPLLVAGRPPKTPAEEQAMCSYDIALFEDALAGPPGTLRGLLASS